MTELSVVDQLAEDANPPEYPPGAPELIPLLQVRPRSRRAEAKRKFKDMQDMRATMDAAQAAFDDDDDAELTPEQEALRMQAWADSDDVLQLMDDFMRLCASDAAAYNAWSDQADDEELTKVFQVFVARSQPGEASSSTS